MKGKRLQEFIQENHAEFLKILLLVATIFLVVTVIPQEGKFRYEFQQGKPWWHEDLIAPFDFTISKTDSEIRTEQEKVMASALAYYKVDTARAAESVRSFSKALTEEWNGRDLRSMQAHLSWGTNALNKAYERGIIEINDLLEGKPASSPLIVLNNREATESNLGAFLTLPEAYVQLGRELETRTELDSEFLMELMERYLVHSVLFDASTTSKARKDQLDNISISKEMKQKGERIISKGDLVDAERNRVLESLRGEFLIQSGGPVNLFYSRLGQVILVTLCLMMILVFLRLFRTDIFENPAKVAFLFLMVFLMAFMAAMSLRFRLASVYMVPFCMLPVLARAFFDIRIALFCFIAAVLVVGVFVPNPYEFVFIQWLAGVFAVFSMNNLRRRGQFFFMVLVVFLSYSLAYSGLSLITGSGIESIKPERFQWFAVSAVLVLFSYPLIFVFEKMFGFVSEVSLMELADINTPLLRELSLKAPGTFQHSLQVANLAEAALVKIGGSSLLVRVGALYHDIGKMDNPAYFIENQVSEMNPHDELSFEESASIITGHVIRGIEKARKNNLPEQVIDFIRTHHGTTKAEYFYKSFQKNFPDEVVDERVFTYPGPKPFSRETAVLMMADSVEAASRSLKRFDRETLEKLVDKVIQHQLELEQFTNCDITFRDINQIKKIFKKSLATIHHLRIEYPQ